MKKTFQKLILCLCIIGSSIGVAKADNIFGEFKRLPDQIEKGFSVGFDFGMFFVKDQPEFRTARDPGFSLSFTTGYDIFDYLAIEGIYMLAINEAAPNDPLLNGSIISMAFDGAAKLQYPIFTRIYPFVEIGGGIYRSNPSWVFPENNNVWNMLFAAGVEYYTYLRHFSLYAKGTYLYIAEIAPNAQPATFNMSMGLKYTF